eukprot:10219336-Alexandrium_andersonii.AAC.1
MNRNIGKTPAELNACPPAAPQGGDVSPVPQGLSRGPRGALGRLSGGSLELSSAVPSSTNLPELLEASLGVGGPGEI